VEFITQQLIQAPFWVAALQIIGVNIILSGDNAVVIALACRMLPPRERFWGMILGAGVAVLLRILFTLVVAEAMQYPWLKLVGGILLLWIAVKLLVPEEEGEDKIAAADNLWRAVRIVAIADIVMSLDNVIAIAASAETAAARLDPAHAEVIKTTLIVFGLATSVPMIVAGSALLMALLDRFPILVWGGAGLLGWVAGEIMVKDPAVARFLGEGLANTLHLWAAGAGAVFVLAFGWVLRRIKHKRALITNQSGGPVSDT
jgi:YjbE family integral membrane protein